MGPSTRWIKAVSYTHLDVYKRQVCGLGDDENGEFLLEELKQSGVNTEHVKVTAGLKSGVVPIMVDEDGERVIYVPVSYTHLDVYKRQILKCSAVS